jgi:membrane protein involved in colicin uptake
VRASQLKAEAEAAAARAKAEAEAAAKREAARIMAEVEAAAARAKAQAEAAAAAARAEAQAKEAERERLRGTRATYSLCPRESNAFKENYQTDASFALGCADSDSDQGTYVRLYANKGWAYSGDVPTGLDNALNGRNGSNLPSPRSRPERCS